MAHSSDIFRVAALVLIGVAWFVSGLASAAAMLLVAGGTWMLRYYASSRVMDVLSQLVFIMAGVFSTFGIYRHIWWLDLVVHCAVMLVVTLVIHEAMAHRATTRTNTAEERGQPQFTGIAVYGALAMILWEAGEWIGYHYISQEIGVGILDSVTDVLTGAVGIGVAYWILGRRKIR